MLLDLLIVAGLAVILYLQWKQNQEINDMKLVIGQMLVDLSDAGISDVEIVEDDS
jgi:uncharacterized protein YuzE